MSIHQHPAAMLAPPAAITRILERFERQELEGFISVAIDLLDLMSGDPDAEDATNLEDDFVLTAEPYHAGPGCPIDDPGGQCDEDEMNTDLKHAFDAGPGCKISDNDFEHDGREEVEPLS